MSVWMSVFLGIVQGVSEFLPISSSGHLSIMQNLFGVDMESRLLFDVLLHLGTLFAVCAAYRKDIVWLLRAFIAFFHRKPGQDAEIVSSQRFILLLVVATLPLIPVVFFKDAVEGLTGSMAFIGVMLLVTAALLFFADRLPKGRKSERGARITDALVVGTAQLLAVVPGLSRSGATITAGIFRGFDREFAMRFSFIMSIPAVVAAVLLEIIDLFSAPVDWSELLVYLPGVIAAAVSGYFSIVWLRRLVAKGKFTGFVVYCALIGVALLIYTLVTSSIPAPTTM